jgi:N-acetylneuraminic acid mutarotase
MTDPIADRPARTTPNLALPVPGDAVNADVVTVLGALADKIDEEVPEQIILLAVPKVGTYPVTTTSTALNQTRTRAAKPTGQQVTSAAAAGGRVYVFLSGGLTTVDVYDPATDSWATAPSMPTAMQNPAAASVGGRLYVVGGTTCLMFDPLTGTWTTRAASPTNRDQHAAVAAGGRVYIAGGYTGSTYRNTVDVYDPATNTWAARAPMAHTRAQFGLVADGDKLYAVGGYGGVGGASGYLATVEMYDTVLNTWTAKANYPSAVIQQAAAGIGGKVYVAGGFDGSTALNAVRVYDPVSNAWSARAPLAAGRYHVGGAAVGGSLYVAGGLVNGGGPATITNEAHDVASTSADPFLTLQGPAILTSVTPSVELRNTVTGHTGATVAGLAGHSLAPVLRGGSDAPVTTLTVLRQGG